MIRNVQRVLGHAGIGLALVTLTAMVLLAAVGPVRAAPNASVGVADAAIAQARATLLGSWPDAPGQSMFFDAAFIRAQLPLILYPDPAPGLGRFASASAYDNLTPAQPDVTWDMNGDNRMIVEYRGASGTLVCSKQAVVERRVARPPQGIVLYAGGNLISAGGGNNQKIRIGAPPWSGSVVAFVGGSVDTPTVFDAGISVVTGGAVPPWRRSCRRTGSPI